MSELNNLPLIKKIKNFFPSIMVHRFITQERAIIILLFVFSLIIRVIYFSHTDPFMRTDDAPGHFEYIKFIADNMSLPAINELEQSYHPPLYYLISALFHKILYIFNINGDTINRVLQFFSLCFNMCFLISGTLILKRYIYNKWILYLCISLLYFWPSSILHSARIGNDNLFYFFYGCSLLYLCKWYDEEKSVDLYFFVFFTLLCLFTKVNGLVVLGSFGILIIIKFFQTYEKKKFIMNVFPSIVLLSLGCIGLFAFQIIDTLNGYEVITFANRAFVMGWGETIGVEAKNFLYFDLNIFINEPFTDMFEDWGGRQYFWNYLLKTALFGEFSADTLFLRNCATIMSFLLLLIVISMIVGIMTSSRNHAKKRLPILSNLLLLLLSSAVFRILSPITCSNDFRYIFPVIITFPVFMSSAISFFYKKRLFICGYSIYAIILVFIVCSIIFYVFW